MNKIGFFAILTILLLAGCSTRGAGVYHSHKPYSNNTYHVNKKNKYTNEKTMRPYIVRGVKYYPTVVNIGDKFHGNASWYGSKFHNRFTSNRERYNMWGMTAAHKTLPMNTIVRVTNRINGKSVIVRINDRGPFVATRIIDLSKAAASKIGIIKRGTAPVTLEVIGFAKKGSHKIPTREQLKKLPKSIELNGYAIQIASFVNISGAILTQEKYNKQDGYITVIKDVKSNNGRLFKVWLEGFKSEQEARDYKANNSIFKHAFIVKED